MILPAPVAPIFNVVTAPVSPIVPEIVMPPVPDSIVKASVPLPVSLLVLIFPSIVINPVPVPLLIVVVPLSFNRIFPCSEVQRIIFCSDIWTFS